jgi:hypothetical protein
LPIPKQDGGKPSGSQHGGRRLIVVESDEVVAAARTRPYTSLSDLAYKSPKTLLLGMYALTVPGLLGLKSVRGATSTVMDAWKAGHSGDPSIQRISYTEAKALQMPPGHPVLGTVYAAHPCLHSRYYAIASFHSKVFEDKVAEANRLLMSLGATSIAIEHVYGWDKNSSVSATAQGDGADVGVEAGRTSTSSSNLLYEASFDNDDPPTLPDDLHWYAHEPLWQEVVEGRLKRGMRSFSFAITYDEDHNVNAGLKVKLEKAGLDLGGTFREHVATTWKMTGTFNDKKPA